jgi:hypothetical protein
MKNKNILLFIFFLFSASAFSQIRPVIQRELRLVNPSQAASGYTAIRAAEGTATYAITLPAAAPAVQSILKVNTVSGSTATLEWQSLSSAVTNLAWSLEGNAITAAGTGSGQQYMGTSSAQPLVIATTHTTAQPIKLLTGNTERLRINADGKIGIGTALNASTTLDVGGSFRVTGNSTFGGTADVTGAVNLSSTLNVTSDVTLGAVGGGAGNTLASGFDRLIISNNAGLLKQASIETILTYNGYHVTKAKGFSSYNTAVESIEITPTNGQGNAITIDSNDAISLTLEGAAADMPIPTYYISRNTGTGRFTVYFSSPFTGSINWSVVE